MNKNPNKVRKHPRVFTKKDLPECKDIQAMMKNKTFLIGLLGLTLVEGLCFGYMLSKMKKR
ncbi:MAG: hypothetical protein MJB12_09485 [Firmicutes bacterium]|nr:hypothetical protein [Bacillota bacterium]